RKPGRKTGLFVFAFKKNPVPKGAGFFAVWGISPPVALRLPGYKSVARTKCAAPPPAKITPCSLHYLLSTQNKTPSWQSLRHNPLFPCPCAGDDRENRACEKKCESNHI
ncbi:TPA: hypothetical protein ACLFZX_000001, partial [Klebsiella pneumoniae]